MNRAEALLHFDSLSEWQKREVLSNGRQAEEVCMFMYLWSAERSCTLDPVHSFIEINIIIQNSGRTLHTTTQEIK